MEPLKKFEQKVDLRSRTEMVDFLINHYRYDTMNTWNRSTSYANKVKVWNVIPSRLQDKVFEMMEAEDFYDSINNILENWGSENNWHYQAAFNGRSGGYIVMYEGNYTMEYIIKPDATFNHLSGEYSQRLGRWVQKEEAEKNGWIGKTYKKVSTWPGRSIDQGEDFEGWSLNELRDRVRLVQSFDRMCDEVVSETISMAENCNVVEETVYIPKTVKHIE